MSLRTPKKIGSEVDINISRLVPFEMIKCGIANQLSSNGIDIVKNVSIALFGTGTFIPQGIYIPAKDLDFFIEFGFDNKDLDSAVSKLMRPDMDYTDLSKNELEEISRLPYSDRSQLGNLIKIFNVGVESLAQKILNLSKNNSTGSNYIKDIDITTDKMMFNSTAFSVDVGSVIDKPFKISRYNNVDYKMGFMSLEKSYIRKLTSGRDKDSNHINIISQYLDLDDVINVTRYLRRFNSNEVMEEVVTNLLATAYDFTKDENKVEESYSQLKTLYQEIVIGAEDFDSDHDVFPEDVYDSDMEYHPYNNRSNSQDYDEDNLNDFWKE